MTEGTSMRWIRGVTFLLALPFGCVGEAKQLSCESTLNNTKHWLTIDIEEQKIVGFEYGSATAQGHMCGLGAKREETSRAMKSKWSDASNETTVEMTSVGQPLGKVLLEKKSDFYQLRVLEQAENTCGLAGYIAPHVRLRPGKSACEFPTQAR